MLPTVTVVFWLAALVRAWRWHQARAKGSNSPALRAIAIALLAIAVALTLDLPAVQRALAEGPLDTHTPDNLADLGKQLAIVSGAWACQSLLLHLTRGPEATRDSERARAVLAAAVAIVSTAIYAVPLIAPRLGREPGSGIAVPFITESRLLVLLYAGTVLLFVMMLCWSHRASGSLGSGVWVMGAGCGVMVAYALARITYFSAAHYGHTLLPGVYRLGDVLQVVGLGLIAVGTLIPRLGRALANRRRRRAYTELEPLWQLVTSRVPGVVFTATPAHDVAAWQLDRRVIEIQDGLVILESGLMPPPASSDQPDDADSATDNSAGRSASRLAAALTNSPGTARVVVGGDPASDPESRLITPPDGVDPVRWLVQVARALPQAAVVAADPQQESPKEHR